MDFVSVSIISIAAFAQPERFPTYKLNLNQNYVKLKRILVCHDEGIVCGEIDNDDEDFNIIPKTLEAVSRTPDTNEELITPDNDPLATENTETSTAEEVNKSTGNMFPSGDPIAKQIPDYESDEEEECPTFEIFEDSDEVSEDDFFSTLVNSRVNVKKEFIPENGEHSGDNTEKDKISEDVNQSPKTLPESSNQREDLEESLNPVSKEQSNVLEKTPVVSSTSKEQSEVLRKEHFENPMKDQSTEKSPSKGPVQENIQKEQEPPAVQETHTNKVTDDESEEQSNDEDEDMDVDEDGSNDNGFEIMDFGSDSDEEEGSGDNHDSEDGKENGVDEVPATDTVKEAAEDKHEEPMVTEDDKLQENNQEPASLKPVLQENLQEKVDQTEESKEDFTRSETDVRDLQSTENNDLIDDLIIEDPEGSDEEGFPEDPFLKTDENQKDADEEVDDFIKNVFEEFEKDPESNHFDDGVLKDEEQFGSKLFEGLSDNDPETISGLDLNSVVSPFDGVEGKGNELSDQVISNFLQSNDEDACNDQGMSIIEVKVNNELDEDAAFNELIEEQTESCKDKDSEADCKDFTEEIIEVVTNEEEVEVDDTFQDQKVKVEKACNENDTKNIAKVSVKEEVAVKPPAPFICHICKAESQYRRGFISHMRTKHPESPIVFENFDIKEIKCLQPKEESKAAVCNVCSASFMDIVDYNDHVNEHKNEQPYACGCLSRFSCRTSFGKHRESCNMPIKFCTIPMYAKKRCAMNEAKKGILPTEQGEISKICTICKRSGFTSILAFKDHQNMHTQNKPYKCECGFESNLLTNLILHLKKEGCSLDGTTWPYYAQNYKRSREQKLRSYEGKKVVKKRVRFAKDLPVVKRRTKVYSHNEEQKFKCSDCEKWFSSKAKLVIHKRTMHDLHKCNLCSMMIPKKRLQKHMDVKHRKPLSCDDCGSVFAFEKTLKTHKERVHKKSLLEPLLVACPLCENEIDINNDSFESHLKSRSHWIYEASWMEYNDIDSIPCYDCDEWETTDFETALKHFSILHKKGIKDALEFLGILGKQDPDLIKAVKDKTKECVGLPNIKERQQIEEEKVLLQGTKFAKFITCFICYQHIMIDNKPLDRAIVRHIEKKLHVKEVEEWNKTFELEFYPCQDCRIKDLVNMQMAMQHSKKTHEYSYFEYFEFLRSHVAPAPDSKKKTKCFICFERVVDMNIHLSTSLGHRVAERKWVKSLNITEFPCAFCTEEKKSLLEAYHHAFKEHKQPCLEYMQYLQINTKEAEAESVTGSFSGTIVKRESL